MQIEVDLAGLVCNGRGLGKGYGWIIWAGLSGGMFGQGLWVC